MVTRNALLLTLLAVPLLGIATGCTGKSSTRTVHEGPIREHVYPKVTPAEAKNTIVALYNKRTELSQRINGVKSGKEALDIALDLEKTVLNPSVLSDPDLSGRTEFDSVLSLFNRALDKAIDLDRPATRASGILTRYENRVLANCTEENTSCIRLPMFRGDHLSSKILMRIAEDLESAMITGRKARTDHARSLPAKATAEQVKEHSQKQKQIDRAHYNVVIRYYRLLMMSFELSTSTPNPELDQKYVSFARDYFEYFRSLSPEEKKADLHARHTSVLTRALGHLRNQSEAGNLNERYCKFLIEVNPLDPEMFKSMNLDKRSQRSMISEFIDCTSQKGKLSDMIKQVLAKQTTEAKAQYDRDKVVTDGSVKVGSHGYAYALAALEDAKALANNFHARNEQPTNLEFPFFITEKVYYQQIDQILAMSYWNRVGAIKDKEFLEFVRNYARVQATYVIKVTMQNYGRIMRERFAANNGTDSDYFHEVIKEVTTTSQSSWDDLNDRLIALREFMIKVYDGKYGRTVSKDLEATQKEYLAMKEELSNLGDNFAMAVSSPMSVPLLYYMAKAQGTVRFNIAWWRSTNQWFNIAAIDAINKFLAPWEAYDMPFFKFGSIATSWDHLQKMQVMDYALRIGVFDYADFGMLEVDKVDGIAPPSEVLFFKQAIKDMLGDMEANLRKAVQSLETLERSQEFKDILLPACEDPLSQSMSLPIESLKIGFLLDNDRIKSAISTLYDLHSYISPWREKRNQMQLWISLLENHFTAVEKVDITKREERFNALSATPEQRLTPEKFAKREAIIKAIKDELDRIQDLERQFLAKQIEMDGMLVNKNRDCLARIALADKMRLEKLIARNQDYYKDVHAAMTILQLDTSGTGTTASVGSLLAAAQLEADVIARGNKLLKVIDDNQLMTSLKMNLADALNFVLSVHNVPSLRNVGTYVAGLLWQAQSPLDKENLLKSENRISVDEYAQSNWDTMMRIRSQIETSSLDVAEVKAILGINYANRDQVLMSPNIKYPLAERGVLQFHGFYKDNTTNAIRYTAKQRDFVRTAMAQFGGAKVGSRYVNWYAGDKFNVNWMQDRLGWLIDLHQLDVLETDKSDSSKCGTDKRWGRTNAVKDLSGRWLLNAPRIEDCKAIRISPMDITDYYVKMMKTVQLTETDMDVLDILDTDKRNMDLISKQLQYTNEPNTNRWTYFDMFYRRTFTSAEGTIRSSEGIKKAWAENIRNHFEFEVYKNSYTLNIENAPALLPLRKAPTQIFRDKVREPMLKHLDAVREVEEVIYNLEESVDPEKALGNFVIESTSARNALTGEPSIPDKHRPDRIWRVMTVRNRPGARNPKTHAGTPIYLNDTQSGKEWFNKFLDGFVVNETGCLMLPKAGDPDFRTEPTGNCPVDFRSWKKMRESQRPQIREALKAIESGS